MKKVVLTLVILSLSCVCHSQTIVACDSAYRMVWHDEFDTDGTPDPSKWSYEEGFVRNKEWQWYQAANATCRDGSLVITAKREQRPNPFYNAGSNEWQKQRENIECTSASVTSKGKFDFRYGRVVVRARIPASRGSWPAIWFLGDKSNGHGWPFCGEIDLMEYYPRNGVNYLHANACWANAQGGSVWDSQAVPLAHFTRGDSLWTSQFHIWRMDWDKDKINLYLDDELINEVEVTASQSPIVGEDSPFRKPMYILLNLAMGSSGGHVDDNTLPVRYEIDYVRVYQKTNAEAPCSECK